MMPLETVLKKTPLHPAHLKLGAKLTPFAGFEMPIHYTSILDEHKAVRLGAGLFDVSHMGQFFITGAQAGRFLNCLLSNEIDRAPLGAAVYAHMANEQGGVIDDLIAYKLSPERILLVVNASRIEDDWRWAKEQSKGFDVALADESADWGIVAVQGPKAVELAGSVIPEIRSISRFRTSEVNWQEHKVIAARTGYTGEDGYEIIARNAALPGIWEALSRQGAKISPFAFCGLGARDTLRLEAGFPLWGHELGLDITPIEAGYSWVVRWDKGDFMGKAALKKQKVSGPGRKIFGFTGSQPGPVARQGAEILTQDGKPAGMVTSGSFSPMLSRPIALGFLKKEYWSHIDFILRNGARELPAKRQTLPFYNSGLGAKN